MEFSVGLDQKGQRLVAGGAGAQSPPRTRVRGGRRAAGALIAGIGVFFLVQAVR